MRPKKIREKPPTSDFYDFKPELINHTENVEPTIVLDRSKLKTSSIKDSYNQKILVAAYYYARHHNYNTSQYAELLKGLGELLKSNQYGI